MTQQGGGIAFKADGTCGPIIKRGAPWTCRWQKRGDGKYDVTLDSDVSTWRAIARIDGDTLVNTFPDGSRPLTLRRSAH